MTEAGRWGQASDEVSGRVGLGVGGRTQKCQDVSILQHSSVGCPEVGRIQRERERELCDGVCVYVSVCARTARCRYQQPRIGD